MSAKEMLDFVEKAYKEGNMPVWDYEKIKEEFKEKTAREMFEELGYELISGDDNDIVQYRMDLNEDTFITIVFNLIHETYYSCTVTNRFKGDCLQKDRDCIGINKKLHQAINKQIEELGWK